jgi:2-polyprenyl-6-methoxyphenol hydroxylase-like FAD-dependent oxidoreductase
MTRLAHAIVLGGSWAGMLAAHELSRHVDRVTIVERDILPEGPEHRKGLPQARHAHVLWSGGARIVDSMLPGTTDELLAAGARRVGFHSDFATLTSHGWQHRFDPTQYVIMCGRALLDSVVRKRVFAGERITVRQGTEALQLAGDGKRVTGVKVRDVDSGALETLEADLVLDATGRASRLKHWLSALGVPPVEEDIVDAGIGYATRLFQAPPGVTAGFPAINLAADHRETRPGTFGILYPYEGGRWLATMSSTRGAPLPANEDEFLPFARNLRHPLVADLIETAEPLTGVFGSHVGANRRLYPERHQDWPERLVVFGDSVAAFNPIYGHGMSSAARSAVALGEQVTRGEFGPGFTRRVQQAISTAVDDPWIMAASRDIVYVDCRTQVSDPRLTGGATARQRFADMVAAKATRAPAVCEVVTNVMALAAPQSELGSNRFLTLLNQDRMQPELTGPPLSPEELDLVRLRVPDAVGAGD